MQIERRILITGFPGFLASALIPRLARYGPVSFTCLVESRFANAARQRADRLARENKCAIRVVTGDIAQPDLALGSTRAEVAAWCTEIFHLAAVYDLAIPLDVATAVNVDGTRHVLDLARGCSGLERFHHVSTCYVSGRHRGVFSEHDLDLGQRFSNHYESTKFVSEVLVQEAAVNGLPTTIYRPAIVTGDSKTGQTQKMDGPYFFIQWLLSQPRLAVLPVFRGSSAATMNIVPSDFVTKAIAFLSTLRNRELAVYNLSDPSPLTIPKLARVLGEATGRRVVRVPATRGVARSAMRTVCRFHPHLDIPGEAVDYLSHPAEFDCRNATADLAHAGIACPRFETYVHRLVSFVRQTWNTDRD